MGTDTKKKSASGMGVGQLMKVTNGLAQVVAEGGEQTADELRTSTCGVDALCLWRRTASALHVFVGDRTAAVELLIAVLAPLTIFTVVFGRNLFSSTFVVEHANVDACAYVEASEVVFWSKVKSCRRFSPFPDGEIAIGATALPVAILLAGLSTRRVSLLAAVGSSDLVLAITLGAATIYCTAKSCRYSTLPLALLPLPDSTFAVPLLLILHGISLLRRGGG